MVQKKIFLLFVAVSTLSFLLHHGIRLNWITEPFYLNCPSLPLHPGPDLNLKHTNVAFLKTHKTASSTMQNLLFRFAERNNLTVALPVQSCGHQFGYPQYFTSHFVHPHTLPPNIITNHMRFNKAELQRLMPADTVYITILREPSTMFESSFTYYHHYCPAFQRVANGSLETFLAEPWRYYQPNEKNSMYAHNTLAFDLGLDKDHSGDDEQYVQASLAGVENVFSLVMIAEYFDESLVVLRHLLSWDLNDILYFKLNMRNENVKTNLTPGLVSAIRSWNSLDARLYDYFNASLWRQISTHGQTCVAREVQALRQAQEKLMKSCFNETNPPLRSASQIKNNNLRPWQPSSKVDIMGYELPANVTQNVSSKAQELCLKLIMPEVQYTKLLLQSQSLRYRQSQQLQPQQQSHTVQAIRRTSPRQSQVQRSHVPPVTPDSATKTGATSNSKLTVGTREQIPNVEPKPSSA